MIHFLCRHAATTAKMGNYAMPAIGLDGVHQFDGIMAVAAAFQSMK